MSNEEMSKEILDGLGGKENITFATHCATRLRVTINDEQQVNERKIESVKGVLGLVKNENEYQVIIGTTVNSVYAAFNRLLDRTETKEENEKVQSTNKKKNYFLIASDFIAGTVLPSLPIIVAGGMISAVLVVCTTFFGLSSETGTYKVLNSIYTAAFTYLPIFIGYNAAKKIEISPMLGALLGAVLVVPDVNGVEGLDFLGIPITAGNYSSSILPVIFGVLFMAIIYKPLDRYIPKEIKFFLVPLLTMLITVPITLICLAPIGTWLGQWIGTG